MSNHSKTLGAVVNDSTFKVFPVFAKLNDLDVKVEYIDPALRESLLAMGRVDVITGQLFRSIIDLRAMGVKDEDIGSFLYKDYGPNLYGNDVAISRSFLKEHPEAVKGFVRATIRGVQDMIRDPGWQLPWWQNTSRCWIRTLNSSALRYQVLHHHSECPQAWIWRCRYGTAQAHHHAHQPRLYGLPREPTVEEMFDASFLPPEHDRTIK